MNIKKQLRNLYLYEIISGFQIADAVWVLFLLERGFSLAQAGLAEGFFHMVSMCCEIPSGMLSDMIGRRRTLILSGIVSAMGSFCMIATDHFYVILIAMGLNAFSYNLVSGTREALTYDSLLEKQQEEQYLKVSSIQENIYLGIMAMTNLLSAVTVTLGYRKVYFIAAVQGILCSLVAVRLTETNVGRKKKRKSLSLADVKSEFISYTVESVRFLKNNSFVRRNMLFIGLVDAGCYVVYMIMQEHLVACGLDSRWIGIPLLFISVFSMAGAMLGGKIGNVSLKKLMAAGSLMAGISLAVSSSSALVISVLAAGFAHGVDEILRLRIENENQKMFSSEIRATMVSVSSMLYSIFMVVLSPAAGWAAKEFSVAAAFGGLGVLVMCLGCALSLRNNYFAARTADRS